MLPSGILICCTGPFWSGSLCLFGFCLPSLRCLISALTQVGGGDLLFRFASSVQSCCGEGGAANRHRCVWGALAVFRPHSVCPLTGVCAFPVYTAQAPGCSIWSWPCVACGSSSPQKRGFGCACVLCLPRASAVQAAKGLRAFFQVRRAFSLRGPSARRRSGLRESLDRNRGLFAGWEGVASLGLSLPLSPPASSYLQWGWGGSSLEFLSPFVLRTAGGVFGQSIFLSLSHSLKKSPSYCSQGLLAGPYPKQCRQTPILMLYIRVIRRSSIVLFKWGARGIPWFYLSTSHFSLSLPPHKTRQASILIRNSQRASQLVSYFSVSSQFSK